MPKEMIVPNPERRPSGFAPATKRGNLVFVSGHIGVDETGKVVGGIREQAQQTFANVETALKAADATMDDVMKITCFLVVATDYKAYAEVREQAFSPNSQPASSTVVVKQLVRPEALIEIEATAVLDS
jgi:enamine deaminase RidA (YjgF/YER057c/UK114 family)